MIDATRSETDPEIINAFIMGRTRGYQEGIEKARQWILHNMPKYVKFHPTEYLTVCVNNEDMANDFKRAMEE